VTANTVTSCAATAVVVVNSRAICGSSPAIMKPSVPTANAPANKQIRENRTAAGPAGRPWPVPVSAGCVVWSMYSTLG